jgi:acyl-CoA thioesterase-2
MSAGDVERDTETDIDIALDEMLAFLAVRRDDRDGTQLVGESPTWGGDILFGGFVLAQAISALHAGCPEGRRLHAIHAHFLRPVMTGKPVSYRLDELRSGRSFSTHRLDARQDGKPALTMTASFTADADGYVYDLPSPHPMPPLDEAEALPGPGPWVAAFLGPTPAAADGTRVSTHRMWFRIPRPLPDDDRVHAALLGFATDWTGIGGRPLHLEGDTQGMVSLDHAAWFHRPARADAWHFYDVQSLVNAGGRGLLRGVMRDRDGRVVVSMAQEMRLTPVERL